MSTSDKKEYALVHPTMQPRMRRHLAARDYSLPKPYRRKVFLEEPPTTSKVTLALWAAAGVLMAGLIAELTSLAQENMRQRRLPIIAAAPPPVLPEQAPSIRGNELARAPAARRAPVELAPLLVAAAAAAVSAEINATPAQAQLDGGESRPSDRDQPRPLNMAANTSPPQLAHVIKKGKQPRPAVIAPSVEPDPDVVLITAILLLSPQLHWDVPTSDPVCTPGAPKDPACPELHGMRP